MTNIKKIVDFIFEINNMKRFKHSGTKFAGVKEPDSIAEHVFRTVQIAYIIAIAEGATEQQLLKIIEITLFHDNGEVRISDLHRIASKYIDSDKAEENAFADQIKNLPEAMQTRISEIVKNYNKKEKNFEYRIARDADLLETAFQAKEYLELGYPTMRWIENTRKHLKTETAKKIMEKMETTSMVEWWDELNLA